MLRLRYFPIKYYIFTLMLAVAWTTDAAGKTTVTVHCGFLKWKNLKSQKITFPNKKVYTNDFMRQSWKKYLKEINKKLTLDGILTDFQHENLKKVPASQLIIIMQRQKLNHDAVAMVPYDKFILLDERIVGINIEAIDKVKKTLKKSLKGKDIPEEFLLSNLIDAEKHERERKTVTSLILASSLLAAIAVGYRVGYKNKGALNKKDTTKAIG